MKIELRKTFQRILQCDGAQLNEAGAADIYKDMQPGETTAEVKRQDIGVSEGKGSRYVGMQTPSVSQHLDQISSDASQLFPNPKRRKISSSPMCDTSDIPNFNLCSFSLGSTQGTGLEGNSAVVVVGEERQERREQQGVGQVSATMAVDFSLAAEQQQLVVMEQQEEQAKRKSDKKGKMIRVESIWLRSPHVNPKQKRRGQD
ncbi:PREDICTED: uncharacterized protein LOC109243713 isoform X2 [Nicotiana attenuata]|uniref:uncharacterized protein LOC109243713 isoform X2 n=1 Tax=Nicotiana attenuata TaxID=49451 RepID=UPI000905C5A2|nr:PREDICTED: uncharacterized protein LOC109243713 isoform X2 [Nicotiana attenuata]